MQGKLCQKPSLNQNGLLIIGTSAFVGGEINEVAAIKIGDPSLSGEYWAITQAGGQALGNTLGSPAIVCDNNGSTYVSALINANDVDENEAQGLWYGEAYGPKARFIPASQGKRPRSRHSNQNRFRC